MNDTQPHTPTVVCPPDAHTNFVQCPSCGWRADQTSGVLAEVHAERDNQDRKWGQQDHPDGTGLWLQPEFYPHRAEVMAALAKRRTDHAARDGRSTFEQILTEEYLEAIAESDPARLRTELIQVAAVAVAWVEAIDRRPQRVQR